MVCFGDTNCREIFWARQCLGNLLSIDSWIKNGSKPGGRPRPGGDAQRPFRPRVTGGQENAPVGFDGGNAVDRLRVEGGRPCPWVRPRRGPSSAWHRVATRPAQAASMARYRSGRRRTSRPAGRAASRGPVQRASERVPRWHNLPMGIQVAGCSCWLAPQKPMPLTGAENRRRAPTAGCSRASAPPASPRSGGLSASPPSPRCPHGRHIRRSVLPSV